MTTRTLKWVGDKAREYPSQYGPKAALSVIFAGENGEPDQKAELKTNADKVADRLAALKELVGKTGEYELQDQGTWDDGNPKPLLIKSYPGKPGSDGGGSPNGGRSGKSPEERASIEKQVALKAAIDYVEAKGVVPEPVGVVGVADVFFTWLQGSEVAELRDGEARSKAASDTTSDGGRSDSGGQAPPSEPSGGDTKHSGEDFSEDAPANPEQIARLKEVYGGPVSATKTAREVCGVQSLADLTQGQAGQLIEAKFKG